ncbi:unnamed protein product [Adineta steineri]|uniref:Resistance to inhibitors of cholinesterase protein 3 N-terminal domain-containing protein n=2 Tax=Adineta steineri TaxID=433720 RepID=A0A818RV47_9BILA|nr:unnamed protein product [Adineta steineri]CAF3660043.1 unnamed protein product [Adineta steineri]
MSLLTRPSVVFAIVFGCFAVLVPRVFIPLFRSKPSTPANQVDDHFRRPPMIMSRNENSDPVEHVQGTPPHMRGAHPSMRMHHPGANNRPQGSTEHGSTKSIVTLALPMYTVGIGIFFIYTCCKYWSKKNPDENKLKTADMRWDSEKKRLAYDILDKDSEAEEEEDGKKQDLYSSLDPDYVEYLKTKKRKALEAERAMTEEQKQMHYALEEMKKSLSFISSKLVTKESRGNLNGNEIIQLQERLMTTEAQMCKILGALDAASDKVTEINQKTKKSPKVKNEENIDHEESLSPSDEEEDETDNKSDEHNHSLSLSSSNSSTADEEEEEDQAAPIEKENYLTHRKRH